MSTLQEVFNILVTELEALHGTDWNFDKFVSVWEKSRGNDMEDWVSGSSLVEWVHTTGGEGKGDIMEITWRINLPEPVYFQFYGDYDSWNGTEWYGKRIVKLVERMVTFYE